MIIYFYAYRLFISSINSIDSIRSLGAVEVPADLRRTTGVRIRVKQLDRLIGLPVNLIVGDGDLYWKNGMKSTR